MHGKRNIGVLPIRSRIVFVAVPMVGSLSRLSTGVLFELLLVQNSGKWNPGAQGVTTSIGQFAPAEKYPLIGEIATQLRAILIIAAAIIAIQHATVKDQ